MPVQSCFKKRRPARCNSEETGTIKELTEQYKEQILPLKLDVTDKDQIGKAVADTINQFGKIDVLK